MVKPASGETRRERLRRELTADILRIARRQLTEAGPSAVTWRAIARELGMNPASLYTYFDSRDDLFTALILETYDSLATAVEEAHAATVDGDVIEHAMACINAYRSWAVAHPAQFNLIYTDQIPGYAAPVDGPTLDAEMRVLQPLVQASARVAGRTADPRHPELANQADVDASLGVWGMFHGLVSLEINNHLPRDGQAERFERIMRDAVMRLGSTQTASRHS